MRRHLIRYRNATGPALALMCLGLLLLWSPARADVTIQSPQFNLSILPRLSYLLDDSN